MACFVEGWLQQILEDLLGKEAPWLKSPFHDEIQREIHQGDGLPFNLN